ncbi:MAG: RNA-binding protein, partial [Ectopseudomonas oleovorans]
MISRILVASCDNCICRACEYQNP